jgi:hypothetical protein
MTIDELRRAAKKKPFTSFVLCLANGRELLVGRPYQIAWPDPVDDARRIGYAHSGDYYDIVELTQIASIRWLAASSTDGDGEEKRP